LDPESFEEAFKILNEKMRQRGESRPVWITEWGCYADDDPACVPPIVGDSTMNHCLWPSERTAAENLVKFAAISFAHGTRKIFLHAGVCGALNGPDAGSILFEYGGAPRKIYAAAASLTRRLGTPDGCFKVVKSNTLRAYLFRAGERFVAVAWSAKSKTVDVALAPAITGFDMMGNRLTSNSVKVGSSPIYLEAASARALVESIETRNSSQ
jgi:hypothetical protein